MKKPTIYIFIIVFFIMLSMVTLNNLRFIGIISDMAMSNSEFFAFQDKLIDLQFDYGEVVALIGLMTFNVKTLLYIVSFSLVGTGILSIVVSRIGRQDNDDTKEAKNELISELRKNVIASRRKRQETILKFNKFNEYYKEKIRELEKRLYKTAETHMPVFVMRDLSAAKLGDILIAAKSKEDAAELVMLRHGGSSRRFSLATMIPNLVYLSDTPQIIEKRLAEITKLKKG